MCFLHSSSDLGYHLQLTGAFLIRSCFLAALFDMLADECGLPPASCPNHDLVLNLRVCVVFVSSPLIDISLQGMSLSKACYITFPSHPSPLLFLGLPAVSDPEPKCAQDQRPLGTGLPNFASTP